MAGGKPCKTYSITKGGETIAVNKEELQQYLDDGWVEGTQPKETSEDTKE